MPNRPNDLPANSGNITVPGHTSPSTATEARDNAGNLNPGIGSVSATIDTDGTLAANSDTRIASQKATKTYVDAEKTRALAAEAAKPTATLDTDTTLAANSDTRVPSQKAIKAYVDAKPTPASPFDGAQFTGNINANGYVVRGATIFDTGAPAYVTTNLGADVFHAPRTGYYRISVHMRVDSIDGIGSIAIRFEKNFVVLRRSEALVKRAVGDPMAVEVQAVVNLTATTDYIAAYSICGGGTTGLVTFEIQFLGS